MLFDLRGRGRRRTVQAIYLGLALMMGGGFVAFGVGSDVSFNIFTGDDGSGSGGGSNETPAQKLDKDIKAALAKTTANPKDPQAWGDLTILRFRRANATGLTDDGYSKDGLRRLKLATVAWEQHLRLDPPQPNLRAAKLMVQAYGPDALAELPKAVNAMQIVTAADKDPTTELYQQLAVLAYQARDERVGKLATDKAVALAPKAERKQVRDQLKLLKTSIEAQAAAQPEPAAATG